MGSRSIVQILLLIAVVVGLTLLGLMRDGRDEKEVPFRLETFRTRDGGLIEGALYSGHHRRVVLLCHGQVFNKESWHGFALALQHQGIDAFAIDFRGHGNSTGPSIKAKDQDVTGAIDHLVSKGYANIGIVGASIGGNATLEALSNNPPSQVDRVAILAASGPGLRSESIDKLFLVAKEDPIHERVLETYANSTPPRNLEVFDGKAHAQHLFRGHNHDLLEQTLIRFFKR